MEGRLIDGLARANIQALKPKLTKRQINQITYGKGVPIRQTLEVKRNGPCICESGKKFKHCCGKKK